MIHFEIPFDNIYREKKFYSLFGAINGGMMKPSSEIKGPVIALEVCSMDQYLERISQAGGKVIVPKMQITEYGYYAYVADNEGNALGLWETIRNS